MNAVGKLVNGYGSEGERTRQDLAISAGQLRDYKERLGKPFQHDAYLTQLTALRDALKTSLSERPQEEGEEKRPDAAEIAEKIKELKASHTIEATPERTGTRRISAEEPVTARIRRRTEAIAVSDPATEPADAASPAAAPSHDTATGQDWSNKAVNPYQERAARGR